MDIRVSKIKVLAAILIFVFLFVPDYSRAVDTYNLTIPPGRLGDTSSRFQEISFPMNLIDKGVENVLAPLAGSFQFIHCCPTDDPYCYDTVYRYYDPAYCENSSWYSIDCNNQPSFSIQPGMACWLYRDVSATTSTLPLYGNRIENFVFDMNKISYCGAFSNATIIGYPFSEPRSPGEMIFVGGGFEYMYTSDPNTGMPYYYFYDDRANHYPFSQMLPGRVYHLKYPFCYAPVAVYFTGELNAAFFELNGGKISDLSSDVEDFENCPDCLASVKYVKSRIDDVFPLYSYIDGKTDELMAFIDSLLNIDVASISDLIASLESSVQLLNGTLDSLRSSLVTFTEEIAYGFNAFFWTGDKTVKRSVLQTSFIEDRNLAITGNVSVSGGLSASRKNFVMEHPLKKNYELVHSALEGPEVGVYYRGEAQLDNGRAVVKLPDYFEALAREEGRTVLLTPFIENETDAVSGLAALPIENGAFDVLSVDSNNPSQKFYWEVKAIRADIEPLETEQAASGF